MRPLGPLLVLCVGGCESCVALEESSVVGGRYVGLDAFEVGGEVVISAVDHWDGARGELVVARLDGARCGAGPVSAYGPIAADRFGGAWGALARFEAEGERGVLSFSDFHCGALPGRIEDVAASPFIWPVGSGWQLVSGGDGSQHVVQPWTGDHAALAGPGSWAVAGGPDRLWVRDGDHLVLRALDGALLRDVATGVTEMTFAFSRDGDASGVAWVDGEGAHLLEGPDDEAAELLAEDACRLAPMWSDAGPALGLLSPCADGRLVIHEVTTSTQRVVASGVTAFSARADPAIFVTGVSPGDRIGDLFLAPAGEAPIFVAERADLSSLDRQDSATPPRYLVLADRDGDRGTLVRFGADGVPEAWKAGVVDVDRDGDHVAYVTEAGALHLRDGAGAELLLAQGVPPGGFAFGWQIPALGFLADATPEGGRLLLRQIGGGLETEVDRGVVEFVEVVSASRPGVAYLIGAGDRAGIWFAEP